MLKMLDYYITLEETKRDIDSVRINSIRIAHEEGLEEGLELGIESERRKNALNMKAKGFDTSLIAECLGISEADVEAILKN